MSDVETKPAGKAEKPDPSTRGAALWAAVIAVPVAIAVGLLIFWNVRPADDTTPEAKASAPVAVPSTPVQMAAPKLTERAAQAFLAVISQLPMKVRDLPARKVSSGPEQNAAYG